MQLPPQAQPPPEEAELRKPPLDVEAANIEIRRITRSDAQLGQAGASSLIARSRSNRWPQVPHSYSYSGMGEVYGSCPGSRLADRRRRTESPDDQPHCQNHLLHGDRKHQDDVAGDRAIAE